MEKITSLQNQRIKDVVRLQKHAERAKQKVFIVEGLKEISLALEEGYILKTLFFNPNRGADIESLHISKNTEIIEITNEVFAKIAYREDSNGLLAIFHLKELYLDDIKLSANPFILIAEQVEKPGNLGAILRTADAAGVDAVIVCDPKTDIFNPNAVRSSVGTLFTNQVVACTNEQAYQWLKKKGIKSYAAALVDSSKPYTEFDYKKPTAIIVGSEAYGLSQFWLTKADQNIIIPMHGRIDSLNVSVSAAIIAFEVTRQRNSPSLPCKGGERHLFSRDV